MRVRIRKSTSLVLGLAALAPLALSLASRAQERVDYERQIKPIFERACFECHGPTKGRGQLRLHTQALAMKGGLSGPVILPGHSADSLIVHRLLGLGDDDRMPLKKEPLTDEEMTLVKAWIDQGAVWPATADTAAVGTQPADPTKPAQSTTATAAAAVTAAGTAAASAPSTSTSKSTMPTAAPGGSAATDAPAEHWAYVKPQRPALPAVTRADWVKNPIDRFILARLDREQLAPSPEAAKATLLRRVTLDLTGLPPTPAELDAFLADTQPDAYERIVDRLLASPRFGERWARPWLDLARYADSNGFEKDNPRTAWKYRDWVIDALNADMPFDRFTIEQIAGDMLPDSTTAQQIATGFHRNAMTNEEGGVDPDESLFDVLVDRVNTTSTVWLGSTVGCAQCHNHKYDPFSQKDYYRLMAFFQNTDYTSKTFGDGTRYFEGQIDLATSDQEKRRAALQQEVTSREAAAARKTPALAAAQTRWELQMRQASAAWTTLTPDSVEATGDVTLVAEADGSIIASGPNPALTTYTIVASTPLTRITALRLEALPDTRLPKGGPGRDPYGHFRLTGVTVDAAPAGLVPTGTPPPTASARRVSRQPADTDTTSPAPVVLTAIRTDDAVETIAPEIFFLRQPAATPVRTAWTIDAMRDDARVPRQAVITPEHPFGYASGTRLTIRLAHLDGTLGQGLGRFRLSVTGTRTPERVVAIPARLRPALTRAAAQRTEKQAADLDALFRRETPLLAREREALRTSRQALADLRIPTALVMREKATFERPSTNLRERGAFNAKGALLYAAVPASLPAMPDSQPMNRLGLARWLVSPDNPLTARVTVNRLWEHLFGRGIVETSEDFGTQGAPPSHPDLLDWLATEFVEKQWSQKAMLRLMVTSATYRQDARVTPSLLERDPYNRLLARGPRFRLEAEMIRDTALAASGLLSAKMHGPSVYPPQPDGVWNNPYSPDKWKTSEGDDRHRRGLYTFIRRTSPYPSLMAFDATSREFCTVRRVRTNTPLQALVLLNDDVYLEAAEALANRLLSEREAGDSVESRLTYAMRLTVARPPEARELNRLRTLFERQTAYYASHPEDARRLLSKQTAATSGTAAATTPASTDSRSNASAPAAPVAERSTPASMSDAQIVERAAWTIIANVLLNLDEMQTKE